MFELLTEGVTSSETQEQLVGTTKAGTKMYQDVIFALWSPITSPRYPKMKE